MFHIHGQHTISKMKLTSSASDQNVYFTYVCLINEVNPSFSKNEHGISSPDHGQIRPPFHAVDADAEDDKDLPIQVERSRALHELVESNRQKEQRKQSSANQDIIYEDSDMSDNEELNDYANPKRLRLTKMNWLSEGREGSVDSSSISLSPANSRSSLSSRESDDMINRRMSFGEKCLSTILKLDREHNMFGLSNIAIVGKKTSKKIRKEDDKPAFPQTAIIQICCGSGKGCCKNMSKTDQPASLKCGGCRSCCIDPYCSFCVSSCGPPCEDPPYPATCYQCLRRKCSCKACQPSKCRVDCTTCYGMTISFKRKPIFEPSPCELTPRSSCILKKPMSARSCHHLPQCIPPSSCFPYLMPCYWPCRESAPCNNPTRCFHNPPCRGPRKRKTCMNVQEICPPGEKCKGKSKDSKCPNQTCPGNIPVMKEAIEKRFGSKNNNE